MTDRPIWLEAAGADDVEALLILERECFAHPWTARNFLDALADPRRGLVLVLRSPSPAGDPRRGLLAYCCFDVVEDEMHIHNLAVREDLRGRGLGRRLLAIALEVAAGRGARAAYLEVRASNWPARELYRSFGFEGAYFRRGYYERPKEDALVMRKGDLGARPIPVMKTGS